MVQWEHNIWKLLQTRTALKTLKNHPKIGAPTKISLIRSGHQNRPKIVLV